eukprot:CAMPEP_0174291022 /NCGR_PEP_ID=MMETSP0809-20121228/30823_1 /TAXON_ID=73025 ORGANISM="Eutreptiella gymnastica-like, Strain CCMP1594" /NCGR_SAMPLE_ID=MMETSP0809 /ASSEMBLY_ACC=CAM_ASM_000658 /LENGTH=538 /DNA_ID=CAMNT_0015390115 /DNA_START=787 /DNA_END=2403 /DNA_ORIENTATION=-
MRSSREDYERRPQPLTRTAAPRFSGDRKSDFVGREPLRGAGREPVESARRPPRGKGGSRPGGDEGIRQRRPPIAQPRRNVPPARVEAYDARQERDRALERERARLRQLREEESSMRERPLKDRGPAYHRSAVALALQRQRQRAQRTQPAKIEADGTLRRAPVAVQRQERIVSADSATAAKARHVVRRKAEGPLEKPCKTLVERIATFLRHSFKATTSEGEQPSGPQVTLEMIKDKMGLRLPLKSLDNMLQGSFNERSVVVVDGYYYSNLKNKQSVKRMREADIVEQDLVRQEARKKLRKLKEEKEQLKEKAKTLVTEEDRQAIRAEDKAIHDAAARKLEAEKMKEEVQQKEERIHALVNQPKKREAEREELEQLKEEVDALRERIQKSESKHAIREVDATCVEEPSENENADTNATEDADVAQPQSTDLQPAEDVGEQLGVDGEAAGALEEGEGEGVAMGEGEADEGEGDNGDEEGLGISNGEGEMGDGEGEGEIGDAEGEGLTGDGDGEGETGEGETGDGEGEGETGDADGIEEGVP